MPGAKRTAYQRMLDLQSLPEFIAQGHSLEEAAKVYKVQISQICKDYHDMLKLRAERRTATEREYLLEQYLANLRAARAAAWDSYRKSREDAETITEETFQSERENGGYSKTQRKKQGQSGNAAMLSVYLKACEMEMSLLGLILPKDERPSVNVNLVMAQVLATGEEPGQEPVTVEAQIRRMVEERLSSKESSTTVETTHGSQQENQSCPSPQTAPASSSTAPSAAAPSGTAPGAPTGR